MGAHLLVFQINKCIFSLHGHHKEKFSSFRFVLSFLSEEVSHFCFLVCNSIIYWKKMF